MKMEQRGCSKMLAYKIQTVGNYPEEIIQHSEHGKSLKSRKITLPAPMSYGHISVQENDWQGHATCSYRIMC